MATNQKDAPPALSGNERKLANGEWWEWIAIFFAILALWPKILQWNGIGWDIALFGALVLMVIVLVRRVRRTKRSWKS